MLIGKDLEFLFESRPCLNLFLRLHQMHRQGCDFAPSACPLNGCTASPRRIGFQPSKTNIEETQMAGNNPTANRGDSRNLSAAPAE
jgi:hypothetical protein